MAKDLKMWEPFVKETKDMRYIALKCVLYSMVICVAVLVMKQVILRGKSLIVAFGGTGLVALAVYSLQVMRKTRATFASLRNKSKEASKRKLKSAMHSVGVALSKSPAANSPSTQKAVENMFSPSSQTLNRLKEKGDTNKGESKEQEAALVKEGVASVAKMGA